MKAWELIARVREWLATRRHEGTATPEEEYTRAKLQIADHLRWYAQQGNDPYELAYGALRLVRPEPSHAPVAGRGKASLATSKSGEEAPTTNALTVHLGFDRDAECPCEWGGWQLYSLSGRQVRFKHPDHFLDGYGNPNNAALRGKLEAGDAFILSYYEHGLGAWSLKGEGVQCPWDTAQLAGVLVWEQGEEGLPGTYEARADNARAFLETYNSWMNGECYYYAITDESQGGVHIDSCGDFYDPESMFREIEEHTRGRAVEYTGEAKHLAQLYRGPRGVHRAGRGKPQGSQPGRHEGQPMAREV
jgi:hypothetical protein